MKAAAGAMLLGLVVLVALDAPAAPQITYATNSVASGGGHGMVTTIYATSSTYQVTATCSQFTFDGHSITYTPKAIGDTILVDAGAVIQSFGGTTRVGYNWSLSSSATSVPGEPYAAADTEVSGYQLPLTVRWAFTATTTPVTLYSRLYVCGNTANIIQTHVRLTEIY